MSRPSDRFDPEDLLAEIGWVQALARQLCGDAHAAEDLAQDAMLVALEGGPEVRPASRRGWLAAVLRNLGRTRRRAERCRAVREAEVARRELAPATVDLLERAATQRELVGALLRLREPYRSTLLLRFYAGHTQREIAERTGVPVSTVGTRIADGLAQLRRKVGSRDRWFAVFAPPLRWVGESAAIGPVSGVLLMTLKTKLILAAVLAVGVCTLWSSDPAAPVSGDVRAAAPSSVRGAVAELAEAAERQDAGTSTEETAASARFDDIPAHAGLVRTQVHGRVIDLTGAPVPGVEVLRMQAAGRLGETGAAVPARTLGSVNADQDGRFEVTAVPPFWLQVRNERHVTVCEGAVGQPTGREVLVVVAPRIPLGGVVVDAAGSPLADVRVSLHADVRRAGHDLSTSSMVYPEVDSDQQGHFDFAGAGEVLGAQLQFRAAGFELSTVPVPVGGDAAMYVVLNRPSASAYTITGRVVLEDGTPAVGAMVSTGVMASFVDAHGAFAIDFEPWLKFRVDEAAPTVVTAVRDGLLPAVRTLPSVREARTSGWPKELVLTLVGAPRSIRGVVVDETGAPVAGVLVEPSDLTPFGIVPEDGMPAGFGVPKSLEQLAGGGSTQTAADGSFELRGLSDREYSLCVLQRPSLLSAVSAPIAAGETGARIVLDRGGLGQLRGHIVGRDGQGIAGVRIAVSKKRLTELVIGSSTVTAADGSFALDGVTRAPAFLRLEGEAIVPELFRRLDPGADPEALELTVGRRRRVQFDWKSWSGRSDEVRVVDARDQPLTMMLLRGTSIGERDSVPFEDGVSDTMVVADSAAFAVVHRNGVEVARVRLDLATDELHVIRL